MTDWEELTENKKQSDLFGDITQKQEKWKEDITPKVLEEKATKTVEGSLKDIDDTKDKDKIDIEGLKQDKLIDKPELEENQDTLF